MSILSPYEVKNFRVFLKENLVEKWRLFQSLLKTNIRIIIQNDSAGFGILDLKLESTN